jgi:hypothetical protein
MHSTPCVTDSASLRQQLMAADPMQRAMALHALEIEAERAAPARQSLCQEAARFASRGIPYYALHDRHFQDWVGKAVSYWERLHAAQPAAVALVSAAPQTARRVGPSGR